MVERILTVELGLDDRSTRARTRFVDKAPAPKPPKEPEVGDPWEPLTVRARLQRMAEVFRRLPHDPDTRPGQHRSCMPTPVREVFKDQPADPMRVPVSRVDQAAATQVLDSLVTFKDTDARLVFWAIAAKLTDRRLGRELRCHHVTAGKRKEALLGVLASDWNARGWRPDATDVQNARALIHRNLR